MRARVWVKGVLFLLSIIEVALGVLRVCMRVCSLLEKVWIHRDSLWLSMPNFISLKKKKKKTTSDGENILDFFSRVVNFRKMILVSGKLFMDMYYVVEVMRCCKSLQPLLFINLQKKLLWFVSILIFNNTLLILIIK